MFQIRNRDHLKYKKCILNKPKSCIKVKYEDNIYINNINKLLNDIENNRYSNIDIFNFNILYFNIFDYY